MINTIINLLKFFIKIDS